MFIASSRLLVLFYMFVVNKKDAGMWNCFYTLFFTWRKVYKNKSASFNSDHHQCFEIELFQKKIKIVVHHGRLLESECSPCWERSWNSQHHRGGQYCQEYYSSSWNRSLKETYVLETKYLFYWNSPTPNSSDLFNS